MRRVAGLVLAAGRASRMGRDKRLIEIEGIPLIQRALRAALEAGLDPVVVVTGPEAQPEFPASVIQVVNPEPGRGMATSLVAGLSALPPESEAVVALLADMPSVGARHVAALVAAFDPEGGRDIVVPVCAGKRGNPVLLGRRLFPILMGLTGDKGARGVIADNGASVVEVEMDQAVLLDLDTPEDVAALGALA